MKLKILIIFFVILTGTLLFVRPAYAAKKRVRAVSSKSSSVSYSSAKLSRSTNSVIINLINLGNVSKVAYELSYMATGISQGVAGTITPTGTTDSRDLYFGTCSKGVCTPHVNIANAQLVVRSYLKTGAVYSKLYRIKF
jgi:hypothetical protein